MSTENLLREASLGKPDKLHYSPSTTEPEDDTAQDYLIFFVSGNPGLIRYYEPFLSRLHSLLSTSSESRSARFYVCGQSYRGFEIAPDATPLDYPLGLEDQIAYQESLLYHYANSHHKSTGSVPKVIIMGHSVGAYVLLELIRRHRDTMNESGHEDFDLIGGVLLFPTIADIAKSPMGKVAKIVLRLPGFAQFMGALVKGLTYFLPMSVLNRLVRMVTRFPDHSAKTTTSFIKSPMGVRQALHLAKDEMNIITEPKWNEEVWGAATSPGTNERDTANSNLVLYWGEGDKWVANETRDSLIKARSQSRSQDQSEVWKPVMIIDKEHIPHDFCTTIRNSNNVADKVKVWIDGIIDTHSRAISHRK